MPLTLADILGEISDEQLRDRIASRELLHVPGGCGMPPEALYSMADWERLLARRGLEPGDLRITFNGNRVDLRTLGAVDERGRATPMAIRDLARQGASIVTSHLNRYEPRLGELAWDVERRTGARALVHVLGSFSARNALETHYDREDLIIVQLSGSKIWRFYGPPAEGVMLRSKPGRPAGEATQTLTLEPGDLLILPAGIRHQCEAVGHSLHLGIALEQPEPGDFVRHLLDSDPGLNEPLPPLLGAQEVAAREAAFKARLIELVEQADIASWLARRGAGRGTMAALDLLGPADPDAPGAVASLATALPPVARRDGRLEAAGKIIEATPAMRGLIAALGEGPRVVAELEAGMRPALDELVAKGLVRIT